MSDVRARVIAAREQLAEMTALVCGACQQNCCHQGTMMGTHGLRRLHKGLLVDPELEPRLRRSLKQRAEEVAADLEVAEKVGHLLAQSRTGEADQEALAELRQRLAELRDFVEYMQSDFPLTADGMSRLLLYSAVRSNLLRCLRQFPGAEAALTTLCQGRGSFRFRGRKIAPPRCVFHLGTCLAEIWKPIKCADFFCTSEPNLLARCRTEMGFDDFVLANIRPSNAGFVRRLVKLETDLGQAFWEPKVIVGPEEGWETFVDEMLALLRQERQIQLRREPGRFMKATNEILDQISALPEGQSLVYTAQSVDGAALYELAVALERARSAQWHGGLLLFARELSPHSFMPHPLWEDEMISQPLGGLEIYLA